MTNTTIDLRQFGLTDQQAALIIDLSRSLCMTEADFCRDILLESAQLLLADPAKIGDIIKDTLTQRYAPLVRR